MKKKLAGKYFFEWLGRIDFRSGLKRRIFISTHTWAICAYYRGYYFESIYGEQK